jgi:predicted amidohydrolase
MERSVRILLAQFAPVPNQVQVNVDTVTRLVREHPDVDIAVFPELALHGYSLRDLQPVDLGPGSSVRDQLSRAAADHHTALVVGMATAAADGGAPANCAVCIDASGEPAGSYAKTQLFGAEPRYFSPGGSYLVTTLAGVAVAPLVCYDLEFPEPARALAAAGAELLVTIAANMDPYAAEHELFSRVRALENRLPHVYVNRVGVEGDLRFCGGSCAVEATGRVVGRLADYRLDVAEVSLTIGATITPDYRADLRAGLPVLRPAVPAR